jgi:dihydroneopterin aldolase
MIDPPRLARLGQRHVFLRDMVLPASIGIYPHEHDAPQRIRINIDLGVTEGGATEGHLGAQPVGLSRAGVGRDDLSRVVDYEVVAKAVRAVVGAGHVMLVETLAERIAETCLVDERVQVVRVRVEKLDVFADLTSVGVEIERQRTTCPPGDH